MDSIYRYITKYTIFEDILIKRKAALQHAALDSLLKPVNSVVRIKSDSVFHNLADTQERN